MVASNLPGDNAPSRRAALAGHGLSLWVCGRFAEPFSKRPPPRTLADTHVTVPHSARAPCQLVAFFFFVLEQTGSGSGCPSHRGLPRQVFPLLFFFFS